MDDMNDDRLMRYKRHLMLPQLDMAGQQKLLDSKVLVIGAGGLGSPVLLYLAAAGIGYLTFYDPDTVEVSNLQRQVLHDSGQLGRAKSDSARERLNAINPDVHLTAVAESLEGDALTVQVAAADLVVDCSDNFTTRFAVNRACVAQSRPLVSGAVIRMEGQVSVFKGHLDDAPCYRCLYREDEYNDETCTSSGVLGPVVGIIGSIQATEAIKLLAGIGTDLCGRLLLLDAEVMRFNEIRLKKDPACPVCSAS
jgi:adenylyltransferase/sulfurtransferase